MIIDRSHLQNNSIINADICIIGGGPAAISIALELENTGKKIIMITGGGWSETAFNQDLNRGIISPQNSHEPLEENRRRQFGGTSAVWSGRCIPFDPIDFEQRPWIPNSGWPLSYSDLSGYYEKATALCLAGNATYNAHINFPATPTEIISGMDDENILSWPLEKWSLPINFAKHYKKNLEGSANIEILLDANVTYINCIQKKENIDNVTVICNGKQFIVTAGTFVLATGGIENARLLLTSKSELHPNGLGNDFDNVGRYYMAHLNGTFAELDVYDRDKLYFDFERENEVYCRRRWWISENYQRQQQIGNAIMFLHQPQSLNGHRDALFSTVFLAKAILSIIRQKSVGQIKAKYQTLRPGLKEHARNMIRNGFSMIPQIAVLAYKRLAKRRLPYILPGKKNQYMGLYFQAEQVPNRESRITVSTNSFDALGVPRAVVSIAFTALDINTVVQAHRVFINKYIDIKAGNVSYNEHELYNYVNSSIGNYNTSAHHLGATRMAAMPENGVVDSNCKVFGIDNLYIAGSSVFTTGGHANPTLTIVALALRLADFLKEI